MRQSEIKKLQFAKIFQHHPPSYFEQKDKKEEEKNPTIPNIIIQGLPPPQPGRKQSTAGPLQPHGDSTTLSSVHR